MQKTISNEIIRSLNSKSNLLNIITDETEELTVKQWVEKYRSIVPTKDIIWLLLREEFLSEKDLRLFAVWCAKEALKLVKDPDIRSVEACNVAERYANGEATKEELNTARNAADYAARIAANDAAYYAYYAAYAATGNVVDAVISAAVYDAVYANYYATKAAYDAAYATYDAARASQLDQLLTYFE